MTEPMFDFRLGPYLRARWIRCYDNGLLPSHPEDREAMRLLWEVQYWRTWACALSPVMEDARVEN